MTVENRILDHFDGIIAKLNTQDEQIKSLYGALKALVLKGEDDPENPGHAFEPESGCNQCTQNCTPIDRDTGPCAYHVAKAALKQPW